MEGTALGSSWPAPVGSSMGGDMGAGHAQGNVTSHGATNSGSSSQQSLGTRVSPDALTPPAAATSDASSVLILQQSLQRLYGSLGQLNHGSRSSLPDILEEREGDAAAALTAAAAAAAAGAALPPQSNAASVSPLHGSGPGSTGARAMSDEDLFGLDMAAAAASGGGGSIGGGAGSAAMLSGAGGGAGTSPLPGHGLGGSSTGALPVDLLESRTLFVRGIDPTVTDQELREFFECFGDVRSLLTTSKHRGFVVISYHDVRAARLAQHTLHGQEWRNRPLSCAPTHLREGAGDGASGALLVVSLDGGRSVQDAYYVLAAYGELRELRDDPSRPHCCVAEYFDARHAAAALHGIASTPELASRMLVLDAGAMAGAQGGGPAGPATGLPRGASAPGLHLPGVASNSHLDAAALLLGNGGGSQVQLGGGLAGMTRSLSEMSLDNGGIAGLGTGSMSAGDLMSQAAAPHSGGGYALRGIASTGSMWPHAAGVSMGSSPNGGSGVWPGTLQDSMAVQQQQQQQAAAVVNAALLQQHQQQNAMLAQNAAVQVALQQALYSHQAAAAAALGGHPGGRPAPSVMGTMPRRGFSDPALGGRLARRPMDPMAEAERRAQQDRLYSLDLGRIAAGEDKRTTLMVKNIPNKYTQKMLLALIEERFKGSFDFFYLPIDFKNRCNVGYAFINMTCPAAISPLVEEFHGRRWPKFNSEKVCRIAYARIQGKTALVQHFQNSSLLHEDKRCRPVLFAATGEAEVFPVPPTAAGQPGLPQQAALPSTLSMSASFGALS